MGGTLRFLAAVALTVSATVATGAEVPTDSTDASRKVVLILSGGGARGAAHVGVLRVLEELHVAPDMIIGTSMGSIVGGLYAAGWSPDEMEQLLTTMDWNSVFSDDVPRELKSFRRKQDDRPVLIDLRLHFNGLAPYVPPGIIGGQNLELLMDAIQARSTTAVDLDHLNIPFRAVAADLGTGQPVVISHASLATAMRASMSIPGVFAPVELDGQLLVDGGSVANLPVKIAKDLGATSVIAVDIGTPIDPSQSWSFLSVSRQVTSLLTAGYRDRDVELLTDDDLLLEPDLGDLEFTDFTRSVEAVELGEHGARARADDLARFTVGDEQWEAYLARQRRRPRDPVTVDRIRIDNSSHLGDPIVRHALAIRPGDQLDPDDLARNLSELHSLRAFGIINFTLDEDGDQHELVVTAPPPPYGRG
ncbi:MAG: patatin-like phospholipase family protein, partial [Holophagae bacterium]